MITNDRTQLAEFLKCAGVNIEQMNVVLPPEYLKAMWDYAHEYPAGEEYDLPPRQIIDGTYIPTSEARSEDRKACSGLDRITNEDETPNE